MNTDKELHAEIPIPFYEEILLLVDAEGISLEEILIRAVQNFLHKE